MPGTATTGLLRHATALLFGLAVGGLAGPAAAVTGDWATHDTMRARLVSPVNAVGEREVVPAGLHLRLEDGWKTYWRSPGDAGAPPKVDWSASTNVAGVDWRWPAPHRFTLFGIETFGYDGEVVFPLGVRAERPGEPVALRGKADVLVCSTICIPVTLDLALDLPAGPAAADASSGNLVARFEAQVPDDGSRSGLKVQDLSAESGAEGTLSVRIVSREPLTEPDVLVESADWTFGKPEFSFSPDRQQAMARLPVVSGPDVVSMPGKPFTITVTDGPKAAEAQATVSAVVATGGSPFGDLAAVLAVALLGGIVLNAMPCVLPVLSLKLLSVINLGDDERRRVRVGFLATAAGVLAAMFLLAGALIGLKLAGAAVGWGLQFQHPVFLVVMAAVLIAFAVNLAGGFELPLPSRIATFLGSTGKPGLVGEFATGAFATVLATPCSAPFVGTAVGFALARGSVEILAIFAALGLGLAAPYLLVTAFPALVRVLPRPGRWMVGLRRVLSVALIGTAIWLLAVLAAQTSWQAALAVATALALLGMTLRFGQRIGAVTASVLVAMSLSGALASPALLATATESNDAATTAWAPFDQAEIGRLVAQGKTVFVDVTADWCITCKANKTLVLDRDDVAAALAGPGVVAMRADWTRPDQRISDYLARYDRYGIPFNAVYGPGAPNGIALPELLTRYGVFEALRTARGTQMIGSQAVRSPGSE